MTAQQPGLPFSLDPLMAEAKRRARQRRVLVALIAVVAVAAVAALGLELRGLGSVAPVPANLTILAVGNEGMVGQIGQRARFHLRCDPASGNVAEPAKACAAVGAEPSLVTNPKPVFNGGSDSWYFTITGSLNGKPVHVGLGGDWMPQMGLIGKLGLAGPHGRPLRLEPLRHGFVGLNQTRRFAPGVLRPGDLVTCRVPHSYQGVQLATSVPVHHGLARWFGATPGVMAVQVRPNGAVIASCLARNRLQLSKRGRTRLPHGWPP
jgi:hypothetical protein